MTEKCLLFPIDNLWLDCFSFLVLAWINIKLFLFKWLWFSTDPVITLDIQGLQVVRNVNREESLGVKENNVLLIDAIWSDESVCTILLWLRKLRICWGNLSVNFRLRTLYKLDIWFLYCLRIIYALKTKVCHFLDLCSHNLTIFTPFGLHGFRKRAFFV